MQIYTKSRLIGFIIMLISFNNGYSQDNYDLTFEDSYIRTGIYGSGYGYGIYFRNAIKTDFKKTSLMYEINLGNIKSSREKRVLNNLIPDASPFVYYKTNRLYVLRPMIGLSKHISKKSNKSNIDVVGFAAIGPVLCFLKPIYLDVISNDTDFNGNRQIQSVKYEPKTINHNRVIGNSSFSRGIEKTKLIGGLGLKSGVCFDWGNYRSDFKSIELGFQIDYFPSQPELIYGTKNKSIFSAFYISFAFGKNY